MLSMINPDSVTRFDSHAKFSTSNLKQHNDHHHHDMFDHHEGTADSAGKKGGKSSMLNFPPNTKTMSNFYPGPLGSVDERLGTTGGIRNRPTSAKLKKGGIPKGSNIPANVKLAKKM